MTLTTKPFTRLLAGGLLLGLPLTVLGQSYQYIGDEEWYDPTDWFDGDTYEIEEWDAYEYDNDWDEYSWHDSWNYDYDTNDSNVSDYTYDENDESWTSSEDSDAYSWTSYHPIGYSYYMTWEPVAYSNNQNGNQNNRNSNANRNSSQSSNDRANQQGGEKTFHGTVKAFRHTELKDREGTSDSYTLARVKLDNGHTVVMSLGEKDRVERLDLERGDKISIRGQTGRLGDKDILIAQQIRANGSSVRVNGRVARLQEKSSENNYREMDQPYQRNSQASRNNNQNRQNDRYEQASRDNNRAWQNDRYEQTTRNNEQNRSNTMRLNGTVEDFQSVHLDGTADAETFVRVELENGRSATVSLGKSASMGDLDLEEGDSIMVSGERDTVDGKTVLRAERIRVEGEKVELSSNF